MDRAIAYYRISTRAQDRSALGIEAQHAAGLRSADAEDISIIADTSRRRAGRAAVRSSAGRSSEPLAEARQARCPVIVAKLDRLSRDVAFISGLMAQRVPFLVAELRERRASRRLAG